MRGLVPRIHVFLYKANEDVDGRDKPGHDGGEVSAPTGEIVICDRPALRGDRGRYQAQATAPPIM